MLPLAAISLLLAAGNVSSQPSSDLGGTLLGIAAVITAVGAIFLGIRTQRRSALGGGSDRIVADLADLLSERTDERDAARRTLDQARMHVGYLEGELAEVKAELRRERGEQP